MNYAASNNEFYVLNKSQLFIKKDLTFDFKSFLIFNRYKNGKRTNVTIIALTECIGYFKRFSICNEVVSFEFPFKSNVSKDKKSFYIY